MFSYKLNIFINQPNHMQSLHTKSLKNKGILTQILIECSNQKISNQKILLTPSEMCPNLQ